MIEQLTGKQDIWGAPPLPQVELTNYDAPTLRFPKFELGPDKLEQALWETASSVGGDLEPTNDKVVEPRMIIRLDLEISHEGKPIDALCRQGHLLNVGDGNMPIGFDRGVVGMQVGETKTFAFIANRFEAQSSGEECVYDATVHVIEVLERVQPTIDDEWVAKFATNYASADEMRAAVQKRLEEELETLILDEKRQRVAETLANRVTDEMPQYHLESARLEISDQYKAEAKLRGLELKDYLAQFGIEEEKFGEFVTEQATLMLKQGLALDAWARHFNINIADSDIEDMLRKVNPSRADELLEQLKSDIDQLFALRIATKRYIANCDAADKAVYRYESNPTYV